MKSIDEVLTSVYERDYVTVAGGRRTAGLFKTHGELEAHVAALRAQMKAAAANLEFEKAAALRDRIKQLRAASWVWPGAGADVTPKLQEWTKAALLEVQEYVRLIGKVGRAPGHAALSTIATSSSSSRRSASAR